MREEKKIHFVGVGGVGMGSLAEALSIAGYQVTGSDGTLYEPMKGVLERAKIQLLEGFHEGNVKKVSPDLVIIGNVVRRDNPEVKAWLAQGTKFVSFPEAVRLFLIEDRDSVVVAGTHGKTTTTTWISFLFDKLGIQPSYLIGGVPVDLPTGCRLNSGKWFVGEGDEYDSAFFDKGPKFLHYKPNFLVLTSIEFDHADIYRDLDHIKSSFEKLVALLPGDGLCVARYDDPVVMEVAQASLCPVQTFGLGTGAMWRLGAVEETSEGMTFEIIYKGRSGGKFKTSMLGEHNLMNLVSGIICAINIGSPMDRIREAVESFRGVRRRQEILLRSPITLIDDFAHHPTEVGATLKAVRRRFPEGRLWAFFEPRSATACRNVHQREYGSAFKEADHVLIVTPYRKDLNDDEKLSVEEIITELRNMKKDAHSFHNSDALFNHWRAQFKPGDIVVVMSNGEFGKIQKRVVEAAKA